MWRALWSKAELYIWVVVGDLPPAYLSVSYCRNVYQAFNGYCREMQAWVDAVNAGEPVDKLIAPGNGPKLNRNTNTELGNDPAPQLYDLANDPGERNDLASRDPPA